MERVVATKFSEHEAEANTGRWSKEEHDLFLRGLNEYGKDWKQIGSMIKTRTVVQIRTHAQKYFLATKKQEANGMPVSVSIKASKDKKRPITVSIAKSKPKKTKRDDEGGLLEPLDTLFYLVDAWSSADESTPTSVSELEFLKSPLAFPDIPDNVGVEPLDHNSETLRIPPPPPPQFGRLGLGNALTHDAHQDVHADVPTTYDPIPQGLEYGLLGRWMDAMNEPL